MWKERSSVSDIPHSMSSLVWLRRTKASHSMDAVCSERAGILQKAERTNLTTAVKTFDKANSILAMAD